MKIDLFSDYACPYCYIGKQHLHRAIEALELQNVEIRHRVYLLEPGKISHPERTAWEGFIAAGHGSPAAFQPTFDKITRLAKEVNLDYQIEGILDIATEDAHRLTLYAQEQGNWMPLAEKIFHAHFIENKNIADHDVLTALAVSCGFDQETVRDILAGDQYSKQIFIDDDEVAQREIDLIPHFIVDGQYDIAGVVNTESLTTLLKKALNKA